MKMKVLTSNIQKLDIPNQQVKVTSAPQGYLFGLSDYPYIIHIYILCGFVKYRLNIYQYQKLYKIKRINKDMENFKIIADDKPPKLCMPLEDISVVFHNVTLVGINNLVVCALAELRYQAEQQGANVIYGIQRKMEASPGFVGNYYKITYSAKTCKA